MVRRASSILKPLWESRPHPPKSHRPSCAERFSARMLALENRLGIGHAPRLMRDPAKRYARFFDGAALKFETDRDGDQREGIGKTIPDLQIGVVASEALRRQLDRDDDLIGGEVGVDAQACLREGGETRRKELRGCPSGRSHEPWHRARQVPRTCRKDARRCRPRSSLGPHSCG